MVRSKHFAITIKILCLLPVHYIQLDCQANISAGHINQVYVLEANETHPAIISCHVRCLNHTGDYNPALLLVQPEEAIFASFRSTSESTKDYAISFKSISSCKPANNYTMEFEYYIYARSAKVDDAVIVCGIVHPHTNPPCWGQSYVTVSIGHTSKHPPPPTTIEPTTSSTVTTCILCSSSMTIAGTIAGSISGGDSEHSLHSRFDPVVVYSPLIAILAVAIVVAISIAIFEGMIMENCHRSRNIAQERDLKNVVPPDKLRGTHDQ